MLTDEERRARAKARHARWAETNRDKLRANSKRYSDKVRAADPEGWRLKGIAYRRANPYKVRLWALRHYGITPEQFDAIHEAQGGRCAICRDEIPVTGKGRHLDHCHVTNRIRGILCALCNLGLGKFKDRVDALEAAAVYLRTADTGITVKNPERLNRPNHRYQKPPSAPKRSPR